MVVIKVRSVALVVLEDMAVTEIMVAAIILTAVMVEAAGAVAPEIYVVICCAQIPVVNVWEAIFVHAYKS